MDNRAAAVEWINSVRDAQQLRFASDRLRWRAERVARIAAGKWPDETPPEIQEILDAVKK